MSSQSPRKLSLENTLFEILAFWVLQENGFLSSRSYSQRAHFTRRFFEKETDKKQWMVQKGETRHRRQFNLL